MFMAVESGQWKIMVLINNMAAITDRLKIIGVFWNLKYCS